MPIERKVAEELERKDKEAREELTEGVLKFLERNPDKMYSLEEIVKAIKFPAYFKDLSKPTKELLVWGILDYLMGVKKVEEKRERDSTCYGLQGVIQRREEKRKKAEEELLQKVEEFLSRDLETMWTSKEITKAIGFPQLFRDLNEACKELLVIQAIGSLERMGKTEEKRVKNTTYYGRKKI